MEVMVFPFKLSMVSVLLLLLFSATSLTAAESIIDRQGEKTSTKSVDYCEPLSGAKVIDTSAPITEDFIKNINEIGFEVVARYYGYNYNNPPPRGSTKVSSFQDRKVISEAEARLLARENIGSVAVFQYHSDDEKTFQQWETRAEADANRALELATTLGQPNKSTIYFGADGDFVHSLNRPCRRLPGDKPGNCSNEVVKYFETVSRIVREADYSIGVYGSGASCKVLTDKGLVDMCWLNFSSGHTGREWGLNSKWTALQQFTEAKGSEGIRRCGRRLDVNWVLNRNFGQFVYQLPN